MPRQRRRVLYIGAPPTAGHPQFFDVRAIFAKSPAVVIGITILSVKGRPQQAPATLRKLFIGVI
jgi:hypothetical protein